MSTSKKNIRIIGQRRTELDLDRLAAALIALAEHRRTTAESEANTCRRLPKPRSSPEGETP